MQNKVLERTHQDFFKEKDRERLQKQTDIQLLVGQYELSLVIPTRNEGGNIALLLEAIQAALGSVRTEVIFVDDSDDATPNIVKAKRREFETPDFHVYCIHRETPDERVGGLATAVELGIRLAQADYIAVLDADLQHPPALLRELYARARLENADLVIASRYIAGGKSDGLDGMSRRLISKGMKWGAKLLFPEHLSGVSDPLGGFFLFRRSLLTNVPLRPIGYKILLEILMRSRWNHIVEVPYSFQAREHGQSKATLHQGITALRHMARLFFDVPTAGWFWKALALVLVNILCVFFLMVCKHFFSGIEIGVVGSFSLITCVINFLLLRAFFFPQTRSVVSDAHLKANAKVEEDWSLRPLSFYKRPPSKRERKQERIFSLFAIILVVAGVAGIVWTQLGTWIVGATLLVGLGFILTIINDIPGKSINRNKYVSMALGIAVGVGIIDYISWRIAVTNWSGWWVASPLLIAEILGALHTLGFQYTLWPRQQPSLHITEDASQLPIYVFIPTVNEGNTVLEPTIQGVLAARQAYLKRYPNAKITIVVCNDGFVAKARDWEATEVLAAQYGVTCVTRKVAGGAKAGNIEYARQQLGAVGDALLVIFDADQVAKPDFFLKTIVAFGDPHIGWVQTGQYYRNLDNPVARWADDQQALFYQLLCPGKAASNAAFICGTNVVIRASALDEIGGLPQDSVTEDFSASIALHHRWKSVFLKEVLATGLGPMDVPSYLKQQRRWAIGTLSVLRTHWKSLFLPKRNGLSGEQRIQYFLACTHYLCGIRDCIYLLSPILFVITGIPALRGSTLDLFLWHFIPFWLVTTVAFFYAGRGATGLRGIIIGFGSFPALIESLLSVVLQRKIGFMVTSKQQQKNRSLGYLVMYILALLLCFMCIGLSFRATPAQRTSMFISVLWIIYFVFLIGAFLLLCIKDIRFASRPQKTGQELDTAQFVYAPSRVKDQKIMRSLLNAGVAIALCLLVLFAGISIRFPTTNPPNVNLAFAASQKPYTGISLPVSLLQKRPAQLEQMLDVHFHIIGRVQDVLHDNFDQGWAQRLSAQQQVPWITLEFGNFEANGKPPLDASLAAIVNGVDDSALQRWAQEIRTYRQPVYLTFLEHTDRNWSLSSAVANGGIPQDAPKAWEHIQAIFKRVGASNVAWVWAPADPADDQAYAPPVTTINAVLISLISYPHTPWANPQSVLEQVAQRYPQKPLFVEVSADGPAKQKAAWLTRVGAAVRTTPSIYTLIYHEGSPAIQATMKDHQQWSMISDPSSAAVMKDLLHNNLRG